MESTIASRSRGAFAALIALAAAILMLGPIAQIGPVGAEPGNGKGKSGEAHDNRPAHADRNATNGQDRQQASGTSAAGSSEDAVTEDDDGDGVENCPDDYPEESQHPSGKDRYCENGNAGNQGKAQHDPDDDGNGPDRSNDGVDQPGESGGDDIYDQDGNNGCGNDQDFEDDNEGWCGKNPDRGGPEGDVEEDVEGDVEEDVEGDVEEDVEGDVEGDVEEDVEGAEQIDVDEDVEVRGVVENRDRDVSAGGDADEEAEVLGVTIDRSPAPDVVDAGAEQAADARAGQLPRTGAAAGPLFSLGILVSAFGGLALAVGRRRALS